MYHASYNIAEQNALNEFQSLNRFDFRKKFSTSVRVIIVLLSETINRIVLKMKELYVTYNVNSFRPKRCV